MSHSGALRDKGTFGLSLLEVSGVSAQRDPLLSKLSGRGQGSWLELNLWVVSPL